MLTDMFVVEFQEMAAEVHQTTCENGWWDEERDDGRLIALMHSELSEALEALRNGNPTDEHCPAFSNLEIELADLIIRVMDFGCARDLRLAAAVVAKDAFNKTRGHHHGGKKF